MLRSWYFAFAFAALLLAASCFGQTTASVTGTVTDSSGAVVPGVTVVITNIGTGISRTVESNESGNYVVTNLGIGNYEVAAEHSGFKKFVRRPITLQVDQTARVDVLLTPGDVSQSVTVTGQSPLVDSERSSIGQVIDNKTIVELPLNGRNFIQLGTLIPGATGGAPGNSAIIGAREGGQSLSVNGQRAEYNNYMLDGIDNNETDLGLAVLIPSIDAIQEFKVQTANYSAEFGRAAGAIVNIATKSGTNHLHGTAYDFLRNQALDARNAFSPQKTPLHQNQFGFSVGGPVLIPELSLKHLLYNGHNRTFFFFNYEWLRLVQGSTGGFILPTAAQRDGDFSGGPTIYDPTMLSPSGQRLPFPNNKIPQGRLNPIALKVLSVFPLPNNTNPARNYLASLKAPTNGNQWTLRLDHTLRAGDQLMARVFYSDTSADSTSIANNGITIDNHPRGGVIGYTRIFSPTIVNDLRVGAQRYQFNDLPDDLGTDYPSQLGLPTFGATTAYLQYPAISISNLTSAGGNSAIPVLRAENTYQLVDTLSIIAGRHSLAMGGDFRYYQMNNYQPQSLSGSYSFTGAFTGKTGSSYANGLGDFLLGLPLQQQILNGSGYGGNYIRNKRLDLFIQDDFKISKKLTLNFGIRWERDGSWKEKYDRWAYFDFSTGQVVYPKKAQTPFTTFPYPYRFDNIESIKRPTDKAFSPRAGFAFRPFDNSSTVIRAAYGVFQGQPTLNPVLNTVATPPPYFLRQTIVSGTTTPQLTFGVFPGVSPSTLLPAIPSFFTLNPLTYRNGYVQQWNMGVERQFLQDFVLKVSYVGSKGTHLDLRTEGNPAWPPGPGAVQARRVFPKFGSITNSTSAAYSNYQALQTSVEKRLSHGLEFLAAYTYSKSLDSTSEWGGLSNENFLTQNPYDLAAEYGRSSTDLRHRFTLSGVYQLPRISRHASINAVVGEWQLAGLLDLQTGFPFTVTVPGDIPNIGQNNASERANIIGNPHIKNPSSREWFNTSAFSTPAPYTFGSSGRNILDAPGTRSLDLSLMKLFPITENQHLQFRAEFFNLPNHPNLGMPNHSLGSTAFGTIQSADSRIGQLALKYIF